jgi:hypothetical protein
VVALAFPASIAAHSELESTTPEDGAVLSAAPAEIVLTFDAPLNTSRSSVTLHDASGTQIAKGGVDPADDTVMRLTPPPMDPGEYEIRWTSVSEDGDLLRDTLHFELTAPPSAPPTPSPTTAPSEAPSEAPTPSPAPSVAPSPSPSADGTPSATTTDVLVPIVAALAVVLLLGAWLLRNRARGARP